MIKTTYLQGGWDMYPEYRDELGSLRIPIVTQHENVLGSLQERFGDPHCTLAQAKRMVWSRWWWLLPLTLMLLLALNVWGASIIPDAAFRLVAYTVSLLPMLFLFAILEDTRNLVRSRDNKAQLLRFEHGQEDEE